MKSLLVIDVQNAIVDSKNFEQEWRGVAYQESVNNLIISPNTTFSLDEVSIGE